ncbi:hypothetical protein Tco_0761163 [Tanacetum coccineum]
MWYAPRSPHVSIGGLYGYYLNKRSATRVAKQKDSEEYHTVLRGREKGRDASLIDRVHDLEGICESLLTPSKEVTRLRGRIFKLETIIQVITLKIDCVQKEEKLKKFLQKEELLQDTSEDEPDNKDDTSPEKDVGDLYCCDVNVDFLNFFVPANPVSRPTIRDFAADLSVLNGFCKLSQNGKEKDDCEHYKYTYSSKQHGQIIRLVEQRQQDDISRMAEEAEQKVECSIWCPMAVEDILDRLYCISRKSNISLYFQHNEVNLIPCKTTAVVVDACDLSTKVSGRVCLILLGFPTQQQPLLWILVSVTQVNRNKILALND